MLTRKLTREEQAELLDYYFGFYFEDDVLMNDDGNEFYRIKGNEKVDFTTLQGVIAYLGKEIERQAIADTLRDIRKVFGIKD